MRFAQGHTDSARAVKFGPDPGLPAPEPPPSHFSLPLPRLCTCLPLPTAPPLPRPLRPTSPLPPLPSPPLRPSPSPAATAAEPRGGAGKPRPPSARAAGPAGQCCPAPPALPGARCVRSRPRCAPRRRPRGGGTDKGGAAGRAGAGARTMASGRGRRAPALRTRRPRAAP